MAILAQKNCIFAPEMQRWPFKDREKTFLILSLPRLGDNKVSKDPFGLSGIKRNSFFSVVTQATCVEERREKEKKDPKPHWGSREGRE